MNPKSILMIHKHLTTYFKVNNGSILIGYYESHGVGIRVIYGVGNRKIIWVAIIKIYWLIVIEIKLFFITVINIVLIYNILCSIEFSYN